MKKISSIISIVGIMTVLGMPVFVSAQSTTDATTNTTAVSSGPEFSPGVNSSYTLLEPLPCIVGTGNTCTAGSTVSSVNIQTYIIYVFKLMIALAVLAAVIMCIIGGFEYMVTESITTKLDAKETIKNAILGLVAALASYLILYTINPNLVNVSLVTVPKLNVTTANINLTPTPIDNTILAGQQAAAANAKDTQLEQRAQDAQTQADTLGDQLSDNNCVDSDGNLLQNANASCQTQYNQWVAAQNTADAAESTSITTHAQDVFAVTTTAAAAAGNDPSIITRQETLNTSEYNTDMAKLKASNDIAGEQTLTQSYNQSQIPLQNQATVLTYKNQTYDSTLDANKAEATAVSNIESASVPVAQSITDPVAQQKFIAAEKAQISAVQTAKPTIRHTPPPL